MDHGLIFEEQEDDIEFLEDLFFEPGFEIGPAKKLAPCEGSARAVIRKLKHLRAYDRAA